MTSLIPESAKYAMSLKDESTGFQAENQYFFERGFLPPTPVPPADFALFEQKLFVEPRLTEGWDNARELIANNGVLILNAEPGTGRRTAALWLLREVLGAEGKIVDLEADWSKPDARFLPSLAERGCVLDLSSEFAENPDPRFGRLLGDFGRENLKRGQLLVVLTSPHTWQGRWIEGTRSFTLDLAPPDAHTVVSLRLDSQGQSDRRSWLDHEDLKQVLGENLRALDAKLLSEQLRKLNPSADLTEKFKELAGQFSGWRSHINGTLLAEKTAFKGISHGQAVARSVVWSGALHSGCRSQCAISGSEQFLEAANIGRNPATVFSEPTSAYKFELASMEEHAGRIRFRGAREGLPEAILDHLWTGYSGQAKVLRKWVGSVLGSNTLNQEELSLVAKRVATLAVNRSDRDLLHTLREALVGDQRPVAVELLTEAALSPTSGAYVRDQLYQWAKRATDPETLTLVAEVCGGELGRKKPSIALTRLRQVAKHAEFGFAPLAQALSQMAEAHPSVVHSLLSRLAKAEDPRERLGIQLALAQSEPGSWVLLGNGAERLADSGARHDLIASLHSLISDDRSGPATHRALQNWGALVQKRHLNDEVTALLVEVYSAPLPHSVRAEFRHDDPYWQKIMDQATKRALMALEAFGAQMESPA